MAAFQKPPFLIIVYQSYTALIFPQLLNVGVFFFNYFQPPLLGGIHLAFIVICSCRCYSGFHCCFLLLHLCCGKILQPFIAIYLYYKKSSLYSQILFGSTRQRSETVKRNTTNAAQSGEVAACQPADTKPQPHQSNSFNMRRWENLELYQIAQRNL